MKKTFRGVYTAIITPFTKEGNIDEEALQRIIEDQIQNKIDGLVPCGTTGESPTLSHEEHDQVIDLTVKFANGRVPVIAGTGSNATSEAIRLSKHAQEAGVDALLQVNPYYNKPTQRGLYLHFKAIADAVDIPVLVYNIKGRTGVNVETPTLVKLMHDSDKIAGVKEASGDLDQMKEVIQNRHQGFSVLSGDDNMTLSLLREGGDGVVSVASNLIPRQMVDFVHAALDGDFEKAQQDEDRLMSFFKTLFLETNPIPIKTAMAIQGWCEESFRLPMCGFTEKSSYDTLRKVIEEIGAPHA
ncbi:MAG TPA: 4-hydroxy-tetrahydrodipicolinate synthase [Sediminispirochaeta sp.]|nr:4-hydroxy-tetrahydrodipicolinate synthase [Sediminispirochaeta sp.]